MQPILDERALLEPAQGVLLWSMRAWVLGLARSLDMGARIRSAFAGIEAEGEDATDGLTGFMAALEDGGTRTVEVERMCSPKLSDDERQLLDVFALVQAGQVAAAAHILRGMARAGAVAAALDRAEDVASALIDAGHLLNVGDGVPAAAAVYAVLH